MNKGSNREMLEHVGIDVSKDKFDACWLRDFESFKKKTKVLKNTKVGHEQLVDWLHTNIKAKPESVVITLEPTNVYHEVLVHVLYEAGFKVFLVNSGKAKKFAQSQNITHKTDKIDAFLLAKYGYSNQRELKLWHPEPKHIRELSLLLKRLSALEKDLQREKNRKNASECGLSSERILASLNGIIEILESEIKALNKDIDAHIKQHPDLKKKKQLLETINGIGCVISREMTYLLSAKNFKNAKQVAAYLGLIPKLHDSGTLKGRTTITKQGPARLRAKLYMPAITASTYNQDIKAQKTKLIAAGKTSKQLICAAMRKLVQICYGVVKSGKEYQPQAI